jgi:hypothetical protein
MQLISRWVLMLVRLVLSQGRRVFEPFSMTYRMPSFYKDESSCPSVQQEKEAIEKLMAKQGTAAGGHFLVLGHTGDPRSFPAVKEVPGLLAKGNVEGSTLTCVDCGKQRVVYRVKCVIPKELVAFIVSKAEEAVTYVFGRTSSWAQPRSSLRILWAPLCPPDPTQPSQPVRPCGRS